MRSLYRAVWIGSLLAILAMTYLFLKQPMGVPEAAPMVPYAAADKSLMLQYPGNWKPQESGQQTVSSQLTFDPNTTTHFAVLNDLVGSLMGDIARNPALGSMPGMPAGATGTQKTPLQLRHEAGLNLMAKNRIRYAEFTPGATRSMQVGEMEALVTEFTFSRGGMMGQTQYAGRRVTIMAPDRQVTILATCARENDKTMGALFDRMIATIHLGPMGG